MQDPYFTETLAVAKDSAPSATIQQLAGAFGARLWVNPIDEDGRHLEIFLANSTVDDEGDEIGVLSVFEPNSQLYVVWVVCLELVVDASDQLLDHAWHIQFEAEVQGEGEAAPFQHSIEETNVSTEEANLCIADCIQTLAALQSLHSLEPLIDLDRASELTKR